MLFSKHANLTWWEYICIEIFWTFGNPKLLSHFYSYDHLFIFQLAVTAVALSFDNSFIISGSKDNSIIMHDTEAGKERTILKPRWKQIKYSSNSVSVTKPHEPARLGEILAVAISYDDRYVASGGRDRKIRIYDLRVSSSASNSTTDNSKKKSYNEVAAFDGHRDAITSLCFKEGSYTLYSSALDRWVSGKTLDSFTWWFRVLHVCVPFTSRRRTSRTPIYFLSSFLCGRCLKHWDLNEMGYLGTMFGHQVHPLLADVVECSAALTLRLSALAYCRHARFQCSGGYALCSLDK